MEPLNIEDPPNKVEGARRQVASKISNFHTSLALTFLVVLVAGVWIIFFQTKPPGIREVRVHAKTYATCIKGAGSSTAVEYRKNMPSDDNMKKIALAHLDTTSTAFLVKKAQGVYDSMFYSSGGVRYVFSGHSVQAAAYSLFEAFDENPSKEITLHTPGYKPIVTSIDADGKVYQSLDSEGETKFTSQPLKEVVHRLDPKLGDDALAKYQNEVLEALGIEEGSLAEEESKIWVMHLGNVVLVKSEDILMKELKPDFEKMKELKVPGDTDKGWDYSRQPWTHTRNIIVGVLFGTDDPVQFKYRCFCPRLGIDEDPVTGTAVAAMITLYSRLKEKKGEWFTAQQTSFSPGDIEGIFEPSGKKGIIQYRGPGTIRSIHELPLKWAKDHPSALEM